MLTDVLRAAHPEAWLRPGNPAIWLVLGPGVRANKVADIDRVGGWCWEWSGGGKERSQEDGDDSEENHCVCDVDAWCFGWVVAVDVVAVRGVWV